MNKTIRTHTETETDAADVERPEATGTADEQADVTVQHNEPAGGGAGSDEAGAGSDEAGADAETETVRAEAASTEKESAKSGTAKGGTATPSIKKRKGAGAAEAADSNSGMGSPPGEVPSRRNRVASRVRKFAVPVLAVLAVAGLVATGILGWQVKQQADKNAAAEAGLAAAREYAVALTSVDSTNLDQDFAAVLDGSTGEFKDMYTRSSGQLRQLLMDNQATGEGTVLDAAVKSAATDKVEVLLFIDQTVTNAASPDPRVDRSRVAMTMDLVDGRWLASRVYLP